MQALIPEDVFDVTGDRGDRGGRDCPLCTSSDWCIVARGRAHQILRSSAFYRDLDVTALGLDAQEHFTLSRCNACDFVYTSKLPSEALLSRIYSDEGDAGRSVAVFARPARAAEVFRTLSSLLKAIASRVETDDRGVSRATVRILDVGCAFGVGALGLVREHFPYHVVGVERSVLAREYLSRNGVQVVGDIEALEGMAPFDGVVLNDVLEHVADPVAFVRSLRPHLHPRSVIWVNVPNFIDWRLERIIALINSGSEEIPKDLNPWEHLSYFSPQTLDTLMDTIGARRVCATEVDYPIARGGLRELLVSLLRVGRDIVRIHRGTYPDRYTTNALYELDDSAC